MGSLIRMNLLSRGVFFAVCAVLLSGCVALPIPNNVQTSPRVHGTVTDASTGRPLADVVVSISDSSLGAGRVMSVRTGPDGKYDVGTRMRQTWFVISFLPGDVFGGVSIWYDRLGYGAVEARRTYTRGALGRGRYQGVVYKIDMRMKIGAGGDSMFAPLEMFSPPLFTQELEGL